MPREYPPRQPLCADINGFSLHAAVRVEAHAASGWSNCAATAPGRPCPTSGFSSTPPGRWGSSSRRPGATAPRTW
jgi:hypothetical protein